MERVATGTNWLIGDQRYWKRDESTNSDVGLHFSIEVGDAALTAGVIGDAVIPFDGIIYGWQILSDGTASAQFDVWRTPAGTYPPTALNSIVGASPPTLTSGTFAQNMNLVDWTNSVTKGDVIRLYLSSQTGVQRLVFVLYIARPGALAESLPLLDQKSNVGHTHDDRYYTETEMNTLLTSAGHNHDDRYYTEAEVDAKVAPGAHTHDDRYYTETEVDTALGGKASLSHSHDAAEVVSGTLSTLRIPGLDAAKIVSGIFPATYIPALDAGKIATGVFDVARIPNIDATKITAGTLGIARIPTGTTDTTVATGNRGTPTGGANLDLLKKTSNTTDHAVGWATANLPKAHQGQVMTLTTINVPDGTTTTVYDFNITGCTPGLAYVVDALGQVSGYGDGGLTGNLKLIVEVGTSINETSTLQLDQGVDATHMHRRLVTATADTAGNIPVRFRHTCVSGIYTFRFQQFSVLAIPRLTYS